MNAATLILFGVEELSRKELRATNGGYVPVHLLEFVIHLCFDGGNLNEAEEESLRERMLQDAWGQPLNRYEATEEYNRTC